MMCENSLGTELKHHWHFSLRMLLAAFCTEANSERSYPSYAFAQVLVRLISLWGWHMEIQDYFELFLFPFH